MTKPEETDKGQIATAAAALANYVLQWTNYYHVKTVKHDESIEYHAFYVTSDLEMNVAYAVGQFLNGKKNALDTCWAERPDGFKPVGLPLTIALEISRRASNIIEDANNRAMSKAQRDRLSEVDQPLRLGA